MITQEHLEHWLKEIAYQLQGIKNEISNQKLTPHTGINLPLDDGKTTFVSFEYLQEKSESITGLISSILYDIEHDNILKTTKPLGLEDNRES